MSKSIFDEDGVRKLAPYTSEDGRKARMHYIETQQKLASEKAEDARNLRLNKLYGLEHRPATPEGTYDSIRRHYSTQIISNERIVDLLKEFPRGVDFCVAPSGLMHKLITDRCG